jgi:hypothetical protein
MAPFGILNPCTDENLCELAQNEMKGVLPGEPFQKGKVASGSIVLFQDLIII